MAGRRYDTHHLIKAALSLHDIFRLLHEKRHELINW